MPNGQWLSNLIGTLRRSIGFRKICDGSVELERCRKHIAVVNAADPYVWELTDLLARWMDIDNTLSAEVRGLIEKLKVIPNPSVLDCAHLEVARGFLASHENRAEDAERNFCFLLELAERIGDESARADLLGTSKYCLARLHRKQHQYKQALDEIRIAKQYAPAEEVGLKALLEITESWLLLNRNEVEEVKLGQQTLDHAERILEATDDYNSQASILAIRGRWAGRRRENQYQEAIRLFDEAIKLYPDKRHRSRTRSLINLAFLLRLRALERPVLERPKEQKALRDKAEDILDKVKEIYGQPSGPHRGLGMVWINRGYIRLDEALDEAAEPPDRVDSFEQADDCADQACHWGSDSVARQGLSGNLPDAVAVPPQLDEVLLTRAWILKCIVAYHRSKAMGERPAGVVAAEKALEQAQKASRWIDQIGKGRLRSRVHTWLGFSLLLTRQDIKRADDQLKAAKAELTDDDRDYVADDVYQLEQEVANARAKAKRAPLIKLMSGDVLRPLQPMLDEIERKIVRSVIGRHPGGAQARGAVEQAKRILKIGFERIYKNLKPADTTLSGAPEDSRQRPTSRKQRSQRQHERSRIARPESKRRQTRRLK